ncbi:MAG: thiamine pyrophosphate-dependent enzyme, partial [Clostridiales bacterium]
MTLRMVSGNEAVAFAALHGGAKVICGYPGTPSSEVIGSLMKMEDFPGTHIEWSTNEKVAIEIAATTAWAGKRALCTMKMSGLNVAYDSMIGIAQSGVIGGLVVYVCDDPGTTTGMCEQDTRGYALMSDMVMLEPGTVKETYDMVKYAFDLSEAIQAPVFVRSVTNVAQSHGAVDIEERTMPDPTVPVVRKNIEKYAKAGAAMCMAQHQDCINALIKAGEIIQKDGLHQLTLAKKKGGLGIIAAGITKGYVHEALDIAAQYGWKKEEVSILLAACTVPYPTAQIKTMLEHCGTIVIAEENDPYLERETCVLAYQMGAHAKIVGKLDGTLSRVGSFNAAHVAKAICVAVGLPVPEDLFTAGVAAAQKSLPRPISCCAGCPHRGTYMAINKALKNAKLKKEDIIVTGDIGCYSLGVFPPLSRTDLLICMGGGFTLAHGMSKAGETRPVVGIVGDSTFFHSGITGM